MTRDLDFVTFSCYRRRPIVKKLRIVVLAIAFLSVSRQPVVGQIDTPPVPPDRDSGELYQRVAASRFVVVGEVSQCQGVGERMTPELSARILKQGDLSLARSGTLYTITVESTLCDRACSEDGEPEVSPKAGDSLYIFVPRDDPYFADGHLRETLTPQRRYMLFLVEPPRETTDLWLKTYSLDPTRTYYRGEHRSRGIIPLPTTTEGTKQPPVATQVTQLCQALRTPTLQGKLDALKQLAKSEDPVVKEQAEIAHKKLQERSESPK